MAAVKAGLVGHQVGLAVDVRANDRHDLSASRCRPQTSEPATVAVNQRQHRASCEIAAASLGQRPLAADEGFVDLDRATFPPKGRKSPERMASRIRWARNHAVL